MNKAAMGLIFPKSAQGWSVSAVECYRLAQAQGIETGDRPGRNNGGGANIPGGNTIKQVTVGDR